MCGNGGAGSERGAEGQEFSRTGPFEPAKGAASAGYLCASPEEGCVVVHTSLTGNVCCNCILYCCVSAAGHDPNDYEIGKRVGLPTINIMNKDGSLNAAAGVTEWGRQNPTPWSMHWEVHTSSTRAPGGACVWTPARFVAKF